MGCIAGSVGSFIGCVAKNPLVDTGLNLVAPGAGTLARAAGNAISGNGGGGGVSQQTSTGSSQGGNSTGGGIWCCAAKGAAQLTLAKNTGCALSKLSGAAVQGQNEQQQLGNTATNIEGQQDNLGQQQIASYNNTFAPAQAQEAQQAEQLDTPGAFQKAAGQAGTDIVNAYNSADLSRQRALQETGASDPGSGSSQNLQMQEGVQEAGAQAGAEQQAYQNAQTQGLQNLNTVSQLGNNIEQQGAQGLSSAAGTIGTASGALGKATCLAIGNARQGVQNAVNAAYGIGVNAGPASGGGAGGGGNGTGVIPGGGTGCIGSAGGVNMNNPGSTAIPNYTGVQPGNQENQIMSTNLNAPTGNPLMPTTQQSFGIGTNGSNIQCPVASAYTGNSGQQGMGFGP